MALITPWMTSEDLINAVKRKISMPLSQGTFSKDDILDFATEEMMISQVPSVLTYHEEYYVYSKEVPLESNKVNYPVPERAIGMKLRDVFLKDSNGNLFNMTRIAPEDQANFTREPGTNHNVYKYFLQNNDIRLAISPPIQEGSSLLFLYFIRPSRLVLNERAAIIDFFTKSVTVDNAIIVAGDTITIDDLVFTAVAGAPSINEFQIGATSTLTAVNLATTINASSVISNASAGSPATAIVTLYYTQLDTTISVSNNLSLALQTTQGIEFDLVPTNITNSSVIDFLQTRPGHKIKKIEITIGSTAISANNIYFNSSDIPEDLVVGDYICLENECIIPFIPTDLHTALAERTCSRILSAIGDQQGMQATNEKISEIEQRQSSILNNRIEGSMRKVRNRNSLILLGKFGNNRRRRF